MDKDSLAAGPRSPQLNDAGGNQYSTGLSRANIERALLAAGKDLNRLQPSELSMLEDFHTMGRHATGQLVDLAGVTGASRVLDAGSGIGGTARYIADRCGCPVAAVDLTAEYCETAEWLNRLVGLGDRISVRQGNVTELPFPSAGFDVVVSQHVQMNVADKARLYAEARRVLADGGRLALWDIVIGEHRTLGFPLPWAVRSAQSHLVSSAELRASVESAGFVIEHWNDLTEQAAGLMPAMLAGSTNPLGLHVFVADVEQKVQNLARGLSDGRLRAVRGLATAIPR